MHRMYAEEQPHDDETPHVCLNRMCLEYAIDTSANEYNYCTECGYRLPDEPEHKYPSFTTPTENDRYQGWLFKYGNPEYPHDCHTGLFAICTCAEKELLYHPVDEDHARLDDLPCVMPTTTCDDELPF